MIGDPAGASIAEIAARVARADNFAAVSEPSVPPVTKAVRDLDLPGVVLPRRNTGQRGSLRDTMTTTHSLTFGTLIVPRGDYTIYTQPTEDVSH